MRVVYECKSVESHVPETLRSQNQILNQLFNITKYNLEQSSENEDLEEHQVVSEEVTVEKFWVIVFITSKNVLCF